jgi:OOP family OmpA-OmpF porin
MIKIFSIMPIMKKLAPVLFISVFLLPMSARSEIKGGSIEISPFAGYNFFEKRQNLEDSPVFGGRLGYNFTSNFGVEATGEFIRSNVNDKSKKFTREGQFTSPTDGVDIIMYHLDLIYHFMPESSFNPFIVAGYGVADYSPKINSKNMSVINFGAGAKYWLTDNFALRLDVRDNMVYDDQIHNIEATLGVVFAFGGRDKAEAAPVAKPVEPPVDSDGDGVPDYLDKCPGTPAGVVVDKNGCPPVAKKVVILASEPKVAEKVVAAVAEKEAEVVVLAFEDVHFDFDQSTLTPEAKTILKRDIQLLKENPNAKIRVAGYTSAAGTPEYNQKLSERRAKAVQEYLISEGIITRDRLSTIGYGETSPAAYEAAPKEHYSDAAKSNMRVLFEIIVE